jgi:hypothetical protein
MGAELPPEKEKIWKKLHVLLAGSCLFSLEIRRFSRSPRSPSWMSKKTAFFYKLNFGFFLHLWLDFIFGPERSESIGI